MCLRDDRDFGPKTDRMIAAVFGLDTVKWDVWMNGVYIGTVDARNADDAEMVALHQHTPEVIPDNLNVNVIVQRHIGEPKR